MSCSIRDNASLAILPHGEPLGRPQRAADADLGVQAKVHETDPSIRRRSAGWSGS